MAGSLGSLVVSLTAETAQFNSAMSKAAYQSQKNFDSIVGGAKSAATAIATLLGVSSFAGFIKSQIDAQDELLKLSQKVGIATDQLSKLQYAAKLSGVDTDALKTALVKLNKATIDTANNTGESRDAFNALGVSIKNSDGSLKTTNQLIGDIADSFSKFKDSASKTAVATAIFGKAGADLIPLLNQGRQGIEDAGKELEKLGGVILPDAARRAEEFNDNLTRIQASASGTGIVIANKLIPILNDLANEFLLAEKYGLSFGDKIKLGLTNPFGNIQTEIRSLNDEFERMMANGESEQSLEAQSNRRRAAYLKEIAQARALAGATGDMSDAVSRRFKSQEDAAKKEIQYNEEARKQQEEAQKVVEKLANEYRLLFLTKNDVLIQELELNGATKQQIENAKTLAKAIEEETNARELQKSVIEGYVELAGEYRKLYEDAATPAQKLADREAELLALREKLIEAGYEQAHVENLIAEARMNAVDKLMPAKQKKEIDDLTKAIEEMGAVIGKAFEDAIVGGKGFSDILKALEQDILRILMRQLVTKPLNDFVSSFVTSFLPGKATGGPVMGNSPYIVGERGPEVFVPSVSGNIVPATQTAQMLSSSGSSQNITINISTPDAQSFRNSMGQTTAQVARMMGRARRNM